MPAPAMAPDSNEHRALAPAEPSNTDAQTPPRGPSSRLLAPSAALPLAPNVLSVKHWSRLLAGALYAASSRIDWPTLVRLVLESLGLPAEVPCARGPTDLLSENELA